MAKRDKLLCKYCKGTEQFCAEYLGNRMGTRWGVRCQLTAGLPIRSFDTEEQAQCSIDEWCTGDGRRDCRPYLLQETKHHPNFNGDLLREFDAMEAATMAKQTYHCACGKTFQKSSSAQDTGYRMDDYNETHECYGCPFVEPVKDWNTGTDKSYECRATAEKMNYTTTGSIALDADHTARVYTLDLPWLDAFINFYLDTPGCGRSITNCDPATLERAFRHTALTQGRRSYGFEFEKNKLGRAARKIVRDQFFDETGKAYQLGCGPSDPKERVLQMIATAKHEAQESAMQMEDEIFGVEDDMAKLEIPEADINTCPYYKGVESTYSPKGYCIDCTVRRGCDRTPYDLKSWALDAVSKTCLDKETYSKCRFFAQAERQKEIAVQDAPELPVPQEPAPIVATEQRTITEVTAEIRYYKTQTVQNIIEIGKRLIEAKELLEHGQWGEWLKNAVEFSHQTANNFMAIAEQFSNSQALGNLNYTKLVTLLTLPTDDRDDFIESTHVVDGEEKTVGEMTTRELQRVIKERDEAKQQLAAAQRDAEQQRIQAKMREDMEQAATRKLHESESKLVQLKDENRRQRLDIERLESKPVDVAVQQPSAAEMESMRTAVRAEVISTMGLPDTYLAKKGAEEAATIFSDAIGGAVANGLVLAMRMDGRAAAKTMEAYIASMTQYVQGLRDKLNIMKEVDRSVKDGAGDVDW